jgi:hypothetical protein
MRDLGVDWPMVLEFMYLQHRVSCRDWIDAHLHWNVSCGVAVPGTVKFYAQCVSIGCIYNMYPLYWNGMCSCLLVVVG